MRIFLILLCCLLAAPPLFAQHYNCPGIYEDLDPGSIVSMSPEQKAAYLRVLRVAEEEAKGDKAKQVMLLAQGTLEIARIAAVTRSEEGKGGPKPSEDDLLQSAQKRVLSRSAAWSRKSVQAYGTAGSKEEQKELEAAMAVVAIANEGSMHTKVYGGDGGLVPDPQGGGFVEFFRSTVAIVTPEYDQPVTDLSGLAQRALCSGTRVSETAVLTAAHCVCALRLADTAAPARKVRIGHLTRINPSGYTFHAAQADVMPGKTSCFDGSGSSSCSSLCAGDWEHGAGLIGRDAALVFTTQFSPVHPEHWSYWNQKSTIAGKGFYGGSVAQDGRHYTVGYGYDPTSSTDFGLGMRRCGQFRALPCRASGLTCDSTAELLLRADSPPVRPDTDACPGDSGGPALIKHKDPGGSPQFYIAGIVSRGPSSSPGTPVWLRCGAAGSLYAFASNPDIANWIKSTVEVQTLDPQTNQRETVTIRMSP